MGLRNHLMYWLDHAVGGRNALQAEERDQRMVFGSIEVFLDEGVPVDTAR